MREIKFRGKSRGGSWYYGLLSKSPARDYYGFRYDEFKYEIQHELTYFTEVTSDTVGQYTGIKDKNGKEIYEGDVIVVGDAKGVVKYREEYARFDVEGIYPSNCWFMMGIEEEWDNIEVIGNIYENPELKEAVHD